MGGLPSGYDHKYIYSHIGYNLKVTDMQAAVGVGQLKKLPAFIEQRRKNFSVLHKGLEKYHAFFILPEHAPHSAPSWFGFPILLKEDAPFTREEFVRFLEGRKIATRMLFGGNLLKQPAYEGIRYRVSGSLDSTDSVMNNLFWIGVYPGLSGEMLDYIVAAFDEFVREKGLVR